MDDKTRALVEGTRTHLVDRLRGDLDMLSSSQMHALGEAAADEIERLRAALAVVTNDQEGDLDFVKFQVRRVLAGEDKE